MTPFQTLPSCERLGRSPLARLRKWGFQYHLGMSTKPVKRLTPQETVTIARIAKESNVSIATVSRVLTRSAKVSQEKQEIVRRVISRHNFRPNSSARRLAGGQSGLIALLMEESSEEFFLNPFWGQVVQGFSSAIADAGMLPLLLIRPKSGTEDSLFFYLASLRSIQKITANMRTILLNKGRNPAPSLEGTGFRF